jgi:hypothetical protein
VEVPLGDLTLGTAWPSLRSLRIPQDFTNFDATSSLLIRVSFDPPLTQEDALGKPVPVPCLAITCQPYKRSGKWDLHLDFAAVDGGGEKILAMVGRPRQGARPTFQPLAISAGLRDQGRVLFIDHGRSVAQHLPSMRGSVLGRLFEPARLVLQPHLPFATVVVCAPGAGLMASTPPGPGQHEARLDWSCPHQCHQQPADLGHR